VHNSDDKNLQQVLQQGCWSEQTGFSDKKDELWMIDNVSTDGRRFDVLYKQKKLGTVNGTLLGPHNRMNALAAIVAAQHVGVPVAQSIAALEKFKGIKRRMEVVGVVNDKTVYDDFAHHPTAITETLRGLRDAVGDARIWAVLEPRSNTMRLGVHKQQLAPSLQLADEVLLFQPADVDWDMQLVVDEVEGSAQLMRSIDDIVDLIAKQSQPGDHILVMSNGAFGGVHQKILDVL
jgi:UDP-N-acetylmuramate: L-alanyl-gamma-D-glutamyl-meso-diaminopimelate ligase